MGYNRHTEKPCECVPKLQDPNVEHAEANALRELKEYSRQYRSAKRQELILRVTYQPCLMCAIEIVKKGVHVVYFRDEKPTDKSGIEYLIKHKVKVKNEWN